jgi:hypothetical protein
VFVDLREAAAVEPVSVGPGNSCREKFADPRDRGGIFGDIGRLRATETALSRVYGSKATES